MALVRPGRPVAEERPVQETRPERAYAADGFVVNGAELTAAIASRSYAVNLKRHPIASGGTGCRLSP